MKNNIQFSLVYLRKLVPKDPVRFYFYHFQHFTSYAPLTALHNCKMQNDFRNKISLFRSNSCHLLHFKSYVPLPLHIIVKCKTIYELHLKGINNNMVKPHGKLVLVG